MVRKLSISYEVFEEENLTVLSVVDPEKDEVVNMLKNEEADALMKKLTDPTEEGKSHG